MSKNIETETKPFAVFVLSPVHGSGYAATTRSADTGEFGKIGLPGGKLDAGENPVDAAYRESKEEGWQMFNINPNPIQKKYVDGKEVWWYKAISAKMLSDFKEKGRIKPIIVSKQDILKSGYGNESLIF
jgi:hypothetical protein